MFRKMRRFKQEVSQEECRQLLVTEKRGVLSVIGDDGYPYAVPMNFYFDESEGKLYFHCAKEGHKIDAIKKCDKVCFTIWNSGYKVEGDWAWYVTSVIVMGRVEFVTDEKIREEKLRRLALKYFPSEDEVEETMESAAARVQMIALNIDHMTGKLVHEK
ncbi:MAG: pyridoxamine 5'-phosphate oxidase family protein [Lachnospiraceae bacterium]|nr:pyridoxamine 5'-phosphate oxidase family protein [Lachnospiraceae bacterium]